MQFRVKKIQKSILSRRLTTYSILGNTFPEYSSYSYKDEPPSGEDVLIKFENRSALAQDLNLLSGIIDLFNNHFISMTMSYVISPQAGPCR